MNEEVKVELETDATFRSQINGGSLYKQRGLKIQSGVTFWLF